MNKDYTQQEIQQQQKIYLDYSIAKAKSYSEVLNFWDSTIPKNINLLEPIPALKNLGIVEQLKTPLFYNLPAFGTETLFEYVNENLIETNPPRSISIIPKSNESANFETLLNWLIEKECITIDNIKSFCNEIILKWNQTYVKQNIEEHLVRLKHAMNLDNSRKQGSYWFKMNNINQYIQNFTLGGTNNSIYLIEFLNGYKMQIQIEFYEDYLRGLELENSVNNLVSPLSFNLRLVAMYELGMFCNLPRGNEGAKSKYLSELLGINPATIETALKGMNKPNANNNPKTEKLNYKLSQFYIKHRITNLELNNITKLKNKSNGNN